MLIVTAAIIEHQGKILITQRKPNKNQALKWEFPGGKIEEGETPKECLAREIKEELDIDIKVNDIFEVVHHKYEKITILLLAYKCSYNSGILKTVDCNNFMWVTLDEMKKYDFAEADIEIVEKLKNTTK
jgi:8-oxo-dGTP diphosphatase